MKLTVAVRELLMDESGQDLVEYALVMAVVGLGLIATIQELTSGVRSLYSSIIVTIAGTGMIPPEIQY